MDYVFERLKQALADRYRVEREIGAGGMATVYLAEDLRHGRKVAVKVLRPDLAAAMGPERFLREIEIAAALTHPHILPLHDSGEADSFLYYVMPFVEGDTLRERLAQDRRLAVGEAARILREIVDALADAHAHGVVHRDIKPANVLLSGRHALVADFGVAKALTEATGRHQMTTVGVAVGTPRYMAPEQASADPNTDHRADLFAVGVVGYEMLTGRSPFAGATTQATFAALLTKTPEPIASLREGVPTSLADAVMRCLEKDPEDRWQSAGDLLGELESLSTPTLGVTPMAGSAPAVRRRRVHPLVLATGFATGAVALWFVLAEENREAWAREVALPEIEQMVDVGDWYGAHLLAEQAEQVIPDDQELDGLRSTFSYSKAVETDPPGALVLRRDYADLDAEWEDLGVTPIDAAVTPYGAIRWRVELEGYQPLEFITGGGGAIRLELDPIDEVPPEMVRVAGWTLQLDDGELEMDDFFLDRFEVTNRAFKEFVDAGGYERPELWEHAITEAGVALPWAEAMTRFVDRTRRPGPSTWEIGSYAEGQADLPVGGVSWYEAAAYARFMGKDLPTVHEWRRALVPALQAYFIPLSNLEGSEAAPPGRFQGMGAFGTYDMAGNVREWTYNSFGSQRLILGGGWNDPYYLAVNTSYSQPALDRSETNGIRLATHLTTSGALQQARAPVDPQPAPDFDAIDPISDGTFDFFRRLFEYDPSPLDSAIESADTTAHWVREKITFDAAYGSERMVLYLYLPRVTEPPFQVVVYFPGSAALNQRSIDQWRTIHLDFAVKSGRAVAFPVYQGTFERDSDLPTTSATPTNLYKDHVIMWAKDLSRSIDYLETRPDVDVEKLAYYGYSWGGRLASVMLAVEPRFDAAALYVAGFSTIRPQAEVDGVNYAPRVTTPVLILSGKYDDVFPLETLARPMFDRLGTPDQDKKHIISDGGHFVPRTQLIGETLAWFDRYLGPVR